jgi:DNA-3-methyladenine glycosylase I
MIPPNGIIPHPDGVQRCWWCGDQPLYMAYHDQEWGVPSADDAFLFEHLSLEAFQAGLSWWIVLRKREAFRAAFAGWDLARVAAFGPEDVARLMGDAGIVRNRRKIDAVIHNAGRALDIQAHQGSLAAFLWRRAPAPEPARALSAPADIPTQTPASAALSKALKQESWRFAGPTGVYAFMQAVGMVNDHLVGCARHGEVGRLQAAFERPG